MWRKQKENKNTCYAPEEHLQNSPEAPTNGIQYDYSNYSLYSSFFLPRYPVDNHYYYNPYYLNCYYAGDYGLYGGYDYWGEPSMTSVCEYHMNSADPATTYNGVYISSPSSTESGNTFAGDCGQERSRYVGPAVTAYGTIMLALQHNIKVEITIDKAIRVTNAANGSIVTMDATGENCGVIHDNGRVWQEGATVHMETGRNTAKIGQRGVVFTNSGSSLVYVVDASGTKSTAEKFRNLRYDFSTDIFFNGSVHGQEALKECMDIMDKLFHRSYRRGDEVWTIAGVRIKQSLWGDVRVTRDFGRRVVRSSPEFGTVSVSTPNVHMALTSESDRLFFVRKGEKRLIYDKNGFSVKNGTQKAGFDDEGLLVLS